MTDGANLRLPRRPILRFRIRTIQILLVIASGPIWALTTAAKEGCFVPVAGFWSVLVLVPVGLMSYTTLWPGSEPTREQLVALCAATAIVGYPLAVLATLVEIGIHQPFGL
jgi:hypothetical protein